MLRRRLLYVIPAVATLLVAAVLLGPAQARSVTVARLLASGSDVRSARIVVVERAEGIERPWPNAKVSLFVGDEATARWSGATDSEGIADVSFDAPVPAGAPVRIVSEGQVLATGTLATSEGSPILEERAPAATVQGGGVVVRVAPERGALVPPFAERVRVLVTRAGQPVAASLKVSALSAEPSETTTSTNDEGVAELSLTPLANPIMLSLEVRGDAVADAEASIGIRMSGVFVAPELDGGRVTVTSPVPRDRVYLSFYDDRARTSGCSVDLTKDEQGFFRGTCGVEMPAETLAVVASGEPNEKGPSTVVWPAPGRKGTAGAPLLDVALDGTRARVGAERRRVSIVRTATVAGLCAAAAIELALLLWTGRRERRRLSNFAAVLDQEMKDAAEQNAAAVVSDSQTEAVIQPIPPKTAVGVSQRLLVVTICALVVLSFAMIAVLVLR
ncbi:MAG: hypothetical protein HOW73_16585 [Polyangiaceae bacterium]|nr:hypothetical protein [Polyangiaceae bacterium]